MKKNAILLLSILSLCLIDCGPTYDCDASAKDYRNDECLLIVEKIPTNTDDMFDYQGIIPETKKKCDCNSPTSERWWALYKDHIAIGDTIIKKKGTLKFSIHKKDTVLDFNFECDGKVYK